MYTYDEVAKKISQIINIDILESATISNPIKKGGIFKIKIKAIMYKN